MGDPMPNNTILNARYEWKLDEQTNNDLFDETYINRRIYSPTFHDGWLCLDLMRVDTEQHVIVVTIHLLNRHENRFLYIQGDIAVVDKDNKRQEEKFNTSGMKSLNQCERIMKYKTNKKENIKSIVI